jgi:hypothetical protein
MTGDLRVGGETRPIAEILAAPAPKRRRRRDWRAVALAPGDWGVVRLRDHGFFFQIASREDTLPSRPHDPGYVRPSSTYSMVVHAIAVASTFLFATWPPPGASSLGGYVIQIAQSTPRPAAPPPEKKQAARTDRHRHRPRPARRPGRRQGRRDQGPGIQERGRRRLGRLDARAGARRRRAPPQRAAVVLREGAAEEPQALRQGRRVLADRAGWLGLDVADQVLDRR